ncbi:MAG: hypothetical protein KatS3mg040_0036 [Candidatus Kapaibacterium sp.]|nr:MAG: hypothetical protein KatS3mg040_0036 [Candidatus Kapabacteria bacterium]
MIPMTNLKSFYGAGSKKIPFFNANGELQTADSQLSSGSGAMNMLVVEGGHVSYGMSQRDRC